jgi:glycosyltransferase involved in cell wall biosynthesis
MRLLATVTFNASQLRSHLLPIIANPEVEEIVLVADEPPPPDLPKLTAVIPSRAEQRLLGRAGSKLARCIRIAARMRPDWILSYNVMPHGVNAHVAARVHRTPTMYHMIGGPDEWRGGGWQSDNAVLGRLPRPVRPLERGLLSVIRGATVVCTMGNSARADLIQAGVDPGKVVVVPPSVDLERFAPASPGSPREYDLLTVGDLIPRKRPWDFISVVAELRRARPGARAAVVGTGPLLGDLKAQAGRLGVADAVDFLGFRDDPAGLYRSARVFVLCSRHEGLSVAMIEAMASGLPCVATEVGDLSDLVRDGRNGFLVPVGDVRSLAKRAEVLLADESRRTAAAAAAREDAASYAGVPRLTEVYGRLLRGEPVPEKAPA